MFHSRPYYPKNVSCYAEVILKLKTVRDNSVEELQTIGFSSFSPTTK